MRNLTLIDLFFKRQNDRMSVGKLKTNLEWRRKNVNFIDFKISDWICVTCKRG